MADEMRGEVKEDILSILSDAIKAIEQNDIQQLRDISDHTVHDASIFQDKYSTSIAVIIYSLAKVFQKHQYRHFKEWDIFYKRCLSDLRKSEQVLLKNDVNAFDQKIKDLYKTISTLEHKFGLYITEVLNQAQIKKGGKVYEHGISAGRAAELLGVTPWELMTYLGQTKIIDTMPVTTKSVKERLKFTKKLFKKE